MEIRHVTSNSVLRNFTFVDEKDRRRPVESSSEFFCQFFPAGPNSFSAQPSSLETRKSRQSSGLEIDNFRRVFFCDTRFLEDRKVLGRSHKFRRSGIQCDEDSLAPRCNPPCQRPRKSIPARLQRNRAAAQIHLRRNSRGNDARFRQCRAMIHFRAVTQRFRRNRRGAGHDNEFLTNRSGASSARRRLGCHHWQWKHSRRRVRRVRKAVSFQRLPPRGGAREKPASHLAPRFLLVGVPSSSIISYRCSLVSRIRPFRNRCNLWYNIRNRFFTTFPRSGCCRRRCNANCSCSPVSPAGEPPPVQARRFRPAHPLRLLDGRVNQISRA